MSGASDKLAMALRALSQTLQPGWAAAMRFDEFTQAIAQHNQVCPKGDTCEGVQKGRQEQANSLADMISHMEESLAAARELATTLPPPNHLPPEWKPRNK